VGFAVGWSDWVTYCAVLGYVSIGIGEFTAVLVPSLAPFAKAVAVGALVGLVALQIAGIRVSSRFQEATTAIKFLAFLAVVVAALVLAPAVSRSAAAAAPPASLVGVVVALQAVVITYGGWQSGLYFTEEDRDPDRNLPRSMIAGVASVIVVYVMVNLALLAVLPIPDLARSTLPAADAAQVLIGDRGRQVITVLSLVSLPPLLNAIMMIGTRILFAMGRDGFLWSRTAEVTAAGTPLVATLVTAAVAVVLIATGTFQKLVAIASFFLVFNYSVCCLALVVLRQREPQRPRPFRAWGYPWSAAIVLAGAAAFLVAAVIGDGVNAAAAAALMLAGLAGRVAVTRLKTA
jgi:APA family basic amino acid/polyamine antiporter